MAFVSLRGRIIGEAIKLGLIRKRASVVRSSEEFNSSKPTLLNFMDLSPINTQELQQTFNVFRATRKAVKTGQLREISPSIRAIASGNSQKIDQNFLTEFPAVEIVSLLGTGYENIDVDYCLARGIMVTNAPNAAAEETADTAIALMLMTLRNFSRGEAWLRAGHWAKGGSYPLAKGTMRHRKLGIVGLGRVGTAVAKRAESFGLPIAYFGPREKFGSHYLYCSSLLELAQRVDTLVVCASGGATTRNIINAQILSALGPDGVLINVARGTCVDEKALIKAIASGQILGAGLDVFQSEPNVRRELLSLERVVVLPHIGAATQYAHNSMEQLVVGNLTSWFRSGRAISPVAECVDIKAVSLRDDPSSIAPQIDSSAK